jgi:acyl-coenzyme A synthetase/AMP-(fatty) acid ligase
LPRNAMGKLERRLLREMVQDLAQDMAGIPAEAS